MKRKRIQITNNDVYIHYGSTKFKPELSFPIKNRDWCGDAGKPEGGLWASREKATYGWKDWALDNEYKDQAIKDGIFFRFKFKPNSRVYKISTLNDLNKLPKLKNNSVYPSFDDHPIDYEKCLALRLDAIELCWYGKEFEVQSNDQEDPMDMKMYTWDCDSVVVLNPNSITILK